MEDNKKYFLIVYKTRKQSEEDASRIRFNVLVVKSGCR